jgi:hypothetical protein
MKTKSIFTSKTFWLNFIVGALAILGLVSPDLLAALHITDPVQFMTIIGAVTAILNVILRMITSQAITPIIKSTKKK